MIIFSIGVAYPQDTKTIAQNTLRSTVLIVTKDENSQTLGLGSGCIIGYELVATNVHVIENAKYVYVDELKSSGYVAIDKFNDLVIIKVPGLRNISLNFSTQNVEVGESVYVAGNPSGLKGSFSDGLISGIRDFNGRNLIQISAPISPGSSGGPVVNRNSELIGISVGGMKNGENLNFCIPVLFLRTLILNQETPKAYNLIKISPKKKEDVYDGIRTGVFIRDIRLEELGYGGGNCIGSFSIFNNLSQPIHNIRVLFIVYDSKGIPIDSFEDTFFDTNNIFYSRGFIPPKLAKKVINEGNIVNSFKVELHYKDRLAIRILNYQIIGE